MSKVIVAHPNIQLSLQLAVGLQKAGLLDLLITRLYTSWQHPPFSYLTWLPRSFQERIENDLFAKIRRNHPDLDPRHVRTIDTSRSLLPIILRRAKLISQGTMHGWLHRNTPRFQRQVADIACIQSDALVCSDRFAFYAFERLAGHRVKRILDLTFVHPKTARRILSEEAERWPELGPSLRLVGVTNADFDYIIEEAEMADYILVASSFARDSCIENGIDKDSIFVNPYGVDSHQFYPRNSERKQFEKPFRFLFVGQIGQRKGIGDLLAAYKRLGLAEAELWLCGNIMGIEHLFDDLPKDIRYLGFIPNSQIPAVYDQVDVFVFPSILEGCGMVILEAMACGLPVITTTHTAGPDFFDNGNEGIIISPGDVDALAEAMLYLYENQDECVEMGKAARRAAENHSWDTYHRQAGEFFENILGRGL